MTAQRNQSRTVLKAYRELERAARAASGRFVTGSPGGHAIAADGPLRPTVHGAGHGFDCFTASTERSRDPCATTVHSSSPQSSRL
jgi:hypothetical protein